jgi:hypothetical protein
MNQPVRALAVYDNPIRDYDVVAVRAVGDAKTGSLRWRYLLADLARVIELHPLQLPPFSVPPSSKGDLVPALAHTLWSVVRLAQQRLSGNRTAAKYRAEARGEATRLLRVCGLTQPPEKAVTDVVETARWAGIDRALACMTAERIRRECPRISERHADFRAWRGLQPENIGAEAFDEVMRTIESHAGTGARRALLTAGRSYGGLDWLPEWEARTVAETGCSADEAAACVAPRVRWLLLIPDEGAPQAIYPIETVLEGVADAADRAAAEGKTLVDGETVRQDIAKLQQTTAAATQGIKTLSVSRIIIRNPDGTTSYAEFAPRKGNATADENERPPPAYKNLKTFANIINNWRKMAGVRADVAMILEDHKRELAKCGVKDSCDYKRYYENARKRMFLLPWKRARPTDPKPRPSGNKPRPMPWVT